MNKCKQNHSFSTYKLHLVVLSVFLFSLSFNVLAQKDSLNRVDAKGLKHGKWEKVEYGKTMYIGQFNHGIPVGKFTYYYDDGKTIKSESIFSANGSTNWVHTYHFNGNLSSFGKFINKEKDSVWVYFSDNNIKVAKESFLLGKKHGQWIQYDPLTGKPLEEVNWKNDKQDGPMQAWSMNDKLRYQINYKNGKANGPYFANYPDGGLYEKGIYKNSLKDSIITYFDQAGKVVHKRKVIAGIADWDRLWIWNSATGKTEVSADSISYVFEKVKSYTVVTKKGQKIKGDGDWTYLSDYLSNIGFFYYTPTILGSHKAPKRLEEIEEGIYKVIFKQDIGFDVIVNESDLGYLKSFRPKLFKKK